MPETPHRRWFSPYPRCSVCGRASAGVLHGVTNESYGAHCCRCAERRLRESERVRGAEAVDRDLVQRPIVSRVEFGIHSNRPAFDLWMLD